MAKHLGCADSNCGYYWQDADEDYPSCHFEGFGKAPCEEDDWDATETEEEDVENGEGFFICPVCGVLTNGVGACYNCGYDPDECAPGDFKEDWTHPNDKPYEEDSDE